MKKIFNYEFEDESERSTISFDYDEEADARLAVKVENGVPVIYGNGPAFLLLAKTFSKLSLCNYRDGFHLHLYKDFDADSAEAIRIVVQNS